MIEVPDDPRPRALFLSEEPVQADLAIVFGSSDPAEAVRRANYGALLYQGGYVPRILLSGGDPTGRGRSEASVMANAAAGAGVPPAVLLVEDRSNSTAENVLFCRRILAEDGVLPGLRTIILVSAWWHLRRVRAIAATAFRPGVRLVPCAGAGDPDLARWVRSPEGCRTLALECELLAAFEENSIY